MAETYFFNILGEPKPKQSAKFTKSGFSYQPKEVKVNEANIRSQLVAQLPKDFEPLNEAMRVSITCFFPLPKSKPKKLHQLLEQRELLPKTTKPDVDNLQKAILDAMNTVVFKDDALIYSIELTKYYHTSKISTYITIDTD